MENGDILTRLENTFGIPQIECKSNNISITIKDWVYTNVMMMEQYLPGIRLVISGDMSPEEAMAETENLAE
jgi:hypothetical protein